MAPVPELADEIQEQLPEVQTYFDSVDLDRPAFPFHRYAVVTGFTSQTNLLGELVLHGEDIARAVKAPWKLDERDILLVARDWRNLSLLTCVGEPLPMPTSLLLSTCPGASVRHPHRSRQRRDA
jgi:hypothetical protein